MPLMQCIIKYAILTLEQNKPVPAISYLENQTDDQVTINDLVNMMTNKCGDLAYSPNFLSRRLKDHFKDDKIIINTEKRGTA